MSDLDTPSPNLPGAPGAGFAGPSCLIRGAILLTLQFIYVASGVCAVSLFAYLGYALIRAEKF